MGEISAEFISRNRDQEETDGSWNYGKVAAFDQTNHSWQRAELNVSNVKGIMKATCYLLYRHFAGGSAFFDDVTFTVVADNADFTDC